MSYFVVQFETCRSRKDDRTNYSFKFYPYSNRKLARSKVQRMMHYEVSLRPFVATVSQLRENSPVASAMQDSLDKDKNSCSGQQEPGEYSSTPSSPAIYQSGSNIGSSNDSLNNPDTPFIYTPQSFPATPNSRQIIMARGGRFADDVVFLARDRLRLHDSLESDNERTREMAKLLREGKRLAVFNARDTNGIELTWYVVDTSPYEKEPQV